MGYFHHFVGSRVSVGHIVYSVQSSFVAFETIKILSDAPRSTIYMSCARGLWPYGCFCSVLLELTFTATMYFSIVFYHVLDRISEIIRCKSYV